MNAFPDFSRNEVINAYFDCGNDLEKAKQSLKKSLNVLLTPSPNTLFPVLPEPSVAIPKPPDPILDSLKDKHEDIILYLCDVFPNIKKEDVKDVFINTCNRNMEECENLLCAVSEGVIRIDEIITKKKKKGKSKKKNNYDNNNNNSNGNIFVPLSSNQSQTPPPPPSYFLPATSAYLKGRDFPLAARIKLKKLCEDFPMIDESVITDIYFENDMNLTKTENLIKNEYLQMQYEQPPERNIPKAPYIPPIIEVTEVSRDSAYDDCNNEKSVEDEMAELEIRIKNRLNHAQQYYRSGKREAGNFEMERVKEDKKRYKELQSKKCESIYNQKNSKMDTCDLHGQTQETALKYVKDAIDRCKSHGLSQVKIITGKGNHSVKNKAVLKPAVQNYLTQNGYRFINGSGDFVVFLK